jgi:hypothetical protein
MRRRLEVGASVCIFHRGRCVLDIAGGSFSNSIASDAKYDERSLQVRPVRCVHLFDLTLSQIVFSNTKGIAAICVGICVDRGLLQALAPPPPHSLLNRKRAEANDTSGSCTTL